MSTSFSPSPDLSEAVPPCFLNTGYEWYVRQICIRFQVKFLPEISSMRLLSRSLASQALLLGSLAFAQTAGTAPAQTPQNTQPTAPPQATQQATPQDQSAP